MISVDIDGYRFQVRAAAVVEHDNHILLHRGVNDSFWALPGAGLSQVKTPRPHLFAK
ncbi:MULTISPECIES: hypothetical protein [Pseudomonas]|uniref:hypothetical protein n=1 Tax=Pseudomonas TaxID=286 RepID=UPI000923C3C5|nr:MULTISPECIES: hypothetical protein [Pseudomonas]SHI29509.1 hypothetical protein SAMN05216295_10112 [Pseudomonas zeshuii]